MRVPFDAVLVFQNFQSYEPDELERSLLFHRLIAQAIAKREASRAGNLTAEHILLGRDILVERRRESMAEPRCLGSADVNKDRP